MPLPFSTVGGSQVLWGRSLLAARLTGLGLGLGALALVALIARQMATHAAQHRQPRHGGSAQDNVRGGA